MQGIERVVAYPHVDGFVEIQHGYGKDNAGGVFDGDWTLRAWFEDLNTEDPGNITKVEVQMTGGSTPTKIQRLGWSKWLRVADSVARNPAPSGST